MDTLTDLLVALMGSSRKEAQDAAQAHRAHLEDTDPAAAAAFAQAWSRAQAQCPPTPTLLGACQRGSRTALVYRTHGVDALVLSSAHVGEGVFLRIAHDIEGRGRTFTDYRWHHDDPSVRLVDELSVLYVYDDGTASFDHAPQVLGLELVPAPSRPASA